jgi:CRP/FNR family transcriptional regulator
MDMTVQKQVEAFFTHYPKKRFQIGDLLIEPEETNEAVFFLFKGVVRMYSISKDGVEHTLNTFRSGTFFPLGPALNNTPNKYYFAAITDAAVRLAPKAEFLIFFKKEPTVMFDLLSRIYKGLDGYFLRMESLLSGDAYFKTIVQLILSTRRFGKQIDDSGNYLVRQTHKQIAEAAGLTRETVTREFKKMQNKKLVSYNGKQLIIHDLSRLEVELPQ